MEIGSEFQLNLADYDIVKNDNIFSYLADFNSIFLDSGRSALRVLNRLLPRGPVLLPSYICKSVIDGFKGREIDFYDIYDDFVIRPLQLLNCIKTTHAKIILFMNYWGMLTESKTIDIIKEYCHKYDIVIIEDTSHSILSTPNTIGDYCICSLRKWFPVARGGTLQFKEIA